MTTPIMTASGYGTEAVPADAAGAVGGAVSTASSTVRRIALVTVGTVSTGLGILGMFLPILPTTCFLLLAAACYARSSPRFYRWLHHNRLFGKALRSYRQGEGAGRGVKVWTLVYLWATLVVSALFLLHGHAWVLVVLALVGTAVTAHVAAIPTLSRERE